MFRLWSVVLTTAIAAQIAVAAVKLPKPDRVPAPPTPEQVTLIREGVALHDRRDYPGAIARYKQVLAGNPWEVTALHELAFTYFESKNYEAALETALQGAQCRSRALPGFYGLIGNALDELGRGEEAIETYKAAIEQNPRIGLLHYNLAISLSRAGKQAEAKAAAEEALECNPNHSSSHAALARVYQNMGYRIPAILAYSRFLVLEPESARAAEFLPALLDLLTKGVSKGKQPNQISIFVSETPKSRADEGDFMSVEMMMSMSMAAELITTPGKTKDPKSAFQKLVSIYTSMGEGLDASKTKGGFARTYYGPYFAALAKAGHVEAFASHALKTGKIEGAAEWAEANPAKIEAFLAWSKGYQWPGQ